MDQNQFEIKPTPWDEMSLPEQRVWVGEHIMGWELTKDGYWRMANGRMVRTSSYRFTTDWEAVMEAEMQITKMDMSIQVAYTQFLSSMTSHILPVEVYRPLRAIHTSAAQRCHAMYLALESVVTKTEDEKVEEILTQLVTTLADIEASSLDPWSRKVATTSLDSGRDHLKRIIETGSEAETNFIIIAMLEALDKIDRRGTDRVSGQLALKTGADVRRLVNSLQKEEHKGDQG